jgi:hypothetical protein
MFGVSGEGARPQGYEGVGRGGARPRGRGGVGRGGSELNFEREGSGARDGGRSAARGTEADAQGGPAGAPAWTGRRAGGSSSTAGEEGQRELEHGLVQRRWMRRRGRGWGRRRQRAEGEDGWRAAEAEPGRRPGNFDFGFYVQGPDFRRIETIGGVLQNNI